jgi:hypothetical protein
MFRTFHSAQRGTFSIFGKLAYEAKGKCSATGCLLRGRVSIDFGHLGELGVVWGLGGSERLRTVGIVGCAIAHVLPR